VLVDKRLNNQAKRQLGIFALSILFLTGCGPSFQSQEYRSLQAPAAGLRSGDVFPLESQSPATELESSPFSDRTNYVQSSPPRSSDPQQAPVSETVCDLRSSAGGHQISKAMTYQQCREHCAVSAAQNTHLTMTCKFQVQGMDIPIPLKPRGHKIVRTASLDATIKVFSSVDYLNLYPDVKAARVDPTDHYLKYGIKEMRSPNILFDEQFYRAINIDVRDNVLSPNGLESGWQHFILYGQAEKRQVYTVFNEAAYLTANPDVAIAVFIDRSLTSGLEHYALYGRREGRAAPTQNWRTGY
jgi:hypothetical protein